MQCANMSEVCDKYILAITNEIAVTGRDSRTEDASVVQSAGGVFVLKVDGIFGCLRINDLSKQQNSLNRGVSVAFLCA